MKLTGAAILISRGMKVLQAAPAAYPCRSASTWDAVSRGVTFSTLATMARLRMTLIELPEWADEPKRNVVDVSAEDYAAIQHQRNKLLQAVHSAVEAYVNDPQLCFDVDEDGFPQRSRLTGAYYIGSESYIAHHGPEWFQISVMCRCLEPPKQGMDREDDYLGLEVWIKCVPGHWSSFEMCRNTDSSSI